MADSAQAFELEAGFVLEDVRVHPLQLLIVRRDAEVRVEPKVMATLVELARHAGRVVSRDAFADTVWRNRVVSDEVLSHNISVLRSALGDDVRAPRFIQTVPTVGYRLVAHLSPLAGGPGEASRFGASKLAVGAIVLAAAALLGWWMLKPRAEPPVLPETTVAVLPFENLGGSEATDYFSDGLTDEVMVALAQAEGLFVVARTSSYAFRDRVEDVRTIGSRLGAGSVLEGSVRRSGERLRVNVNLVSANDGLQLWSESFDIELEDVFEVQDRIARAIVVRLAGTLAPEGTLSRRDTSSLAAFELYLRANHQLFHRGPTALTRSIDLFEDAIALDPDFARAHVGLAQAYAMLPGYLDELEMPYLQKARASLKRAEELGDTSARLLGTLAYVSFREWRWSEAEDYFEQALELTPTDSDVRQQYSQFLGTVGKMSDALAEAQRAVQADPLSAVAHQRLAVVNLWMDDLEQADSHLAMANELGLDRLATPEAAIALRAREGDLEAVDRELRELQRQRNLPVDWIDPVLSAMRGEDDPAAAVRALNDAYRRETIGSRLFLGALYFIGDSAGFFAGLDQLIDQHAAIDTELLFTPIGENLRLAPEFQPRMSRMGIAGYWEERGGPFER